MPDPMGPEQAGRPMGPLRAVVHVVWALALMTIIVVPNLPTKVFGKFPGKVAAPLRQVSFVQSWRMYAPDPQTSQTYMALTAHYPGGEVGQLEESAQAEHGWGTIWAWQKTRVDIWRHYANFNPKKRNDHRKWYLRGVCIREARRGKVPTKIVMEQVRRRFTNPKKVAQGKKSLGRPNRRLVTVTYCHGRPTKEMLAADAEARGE